MSNTLGYLSKPVLKVISRLLAGSSLETSARDKFVTLADSLLIAEAPEAKLVPASTRRALIHRLSSLTPGLESHLDSVSPSLADDLAGVEADDISPKDLAQLGLRGFTVSAAPGLSQDQVAATVAATLRYPVTVKPFPLQDTYTLLVDSGEKPLVSEAYEDARKLVATGSFTFAEPNLAIPAPEGDETTSLESFSGPGDWDRDHPSTRNDYEWSLHRIHAQSMWQGASGSRGQGVTVGHIDTGYTLHPELKPALDLSRDRDFWEGDLDARDPLEETWSDRWRAASPALNPGHGTGTGSVICSREGKDAGTQGNAWVTGTAPGAKLVPYRATPSVVILPAGSQDEVARAIISAADDGMDVISMSLGSPWDSDILRRAVEHALDKGVIVCAAAGNIVAQVIQGDRVTFPARYAGVVAVAGCDYDYVAWSRSCRGPEVDITAPGTDVWRAAATKDLNNARVERGSGTSFSVATVAGIAACWIGRHGGRQALLNHFGGNARLIPAAFSWALKQHTKIPITGGTPGHFGDGVIHAANLSATALPTVQQVQGSLHEFSPQVENAFTSLEAISPVSATAPDISSTFQSWTGLDPQKLTATELKVLSLRVAADPRLLADWWKALPTSPAGTSASAGAGSAALAGTLAPATAANLATALDALPPPPTQRQILSSIPNAPRPSGFFLDPAAKSAGAPGATFEAAASPLRIVPPAGPDLSQRHRAMDLFIHGDITTAQFEEASASSGGFERLVGIADYLPASFLEQGALISRTVCLIRTSGTAYDGSRGSWTGSGALISQNILVTNHHVLNSKEVAASGTCIFNYQATTRGTEAPTKSFRLRPDLLFITSPVGNGAADGLDYTFVWVEGDPGKEFGWIPVDRSAFIVANSEDANIIGHPNGNPKVISIRENQVKWQNETVVHYASDTEVGTSGSPVLNKRWQMIALHHAWKPTTEVPNFTFLNEGIKYSAIAVDLERRSRDRSQPADATAAASVLQVVNGTDENLGFFGLAGRPQPQGADALERVVNSYAGTEQDIDIGFWNVEWLSNRYEAKAAAVAQVIHDLKLDIWCLEESSPKGVQAVVAELKRIYDLDFAWDAAEPDTPDTKQSCTLLWNAATVIGKKISWGEPIETWLQTRSTDFDSLGLESVHGKIFDRYPALYHFTTVEEVAPGKKLDFHVVPLHLKAKDEGSLRRRMASQILAAAIRKRVEEGHDTDYVVGGDFNATLASEDFAALNDSGLVPLSAGDERDGAITYVKRPYLSMIDHVYLSPNLAAEQRGDNFFVIAAEATFPDYIRNISDHRPVILRLSTGEQEPGNKGDEETSTDPGRADALAELRKLLPPPSSLERRRPITTTEIHGYDAGFLGSSFIVPLPGLGALESDAVPVPGSNGSGRFVLPYTHFSVAMKGSRRLPFYSAVNIDGLRRIPHGREGSWRLDNRIHASFQSGNEVYRDNDLDKGHMTRRLDPVWGDRATAARANDDTFFYTNACPQHKDLNQKEWLELEDYVLGNAETRDLRVSVFTGPVFNDRDIIYRGTGLPEEFWKIAVVVNSDTGRLSATGYILSQRDMISEFEFAFGAFKTYQVPVTRIIAKTGLDFSHLTPHDPLHSNGDGHEHNFERNGAPSSPVRGRRINGAADLLI